MEAFPFSIEGLDHVAIRVADMEASADWYARVLGLRRCQMPEWGAFPIFMMAGKVGVALFPAKMDDAPMPHPSKHVKIDHFAFHVSPEALKAAQRHYEALGIPARFQDHVYFHSLYTEDPDGHTVELTALVVSPSSFYGADA